MMTELKNALVSGFIMSLTILTIIWFASDKEEKRAQRCDGVFVGIQYKSCLTREDIREIKEVMREMEKKTK